MSKINNILHIVINTHGRKKTLDEAYHENIYRYLWKICSNRQCHLYRINGTENHVHLLVDIGQKVALADLMRDMKRDSSKWIRESRIFPYFDRWGHEYYAFGVCHGHRDGVIEYIRNQKAHHRHITFEEELRRMMESEGVEWNDYLLT